MDEARLWERIGDFEEGKIAFLERHRLVFNVNSATPKIGYANIIPDKNMVVIGVLYELTEKQLEILDDYEGVPQGLYQRNIITVRDGNNEHFEAVTYMALDCGSDLRPAKLYLDYLIRGAQQPDFPVGYLKMLEAVETASE